MATPGSEAKSVSLVPERGGGRGMSVAPQLAPPSLEKYPRCGRRKISLEAPTRILGWLGLRLMKVSLCGPHSLEAFTLVPTESEPACLPPEIAPLVERYRYLAHHVGLWILLFCAVATDPKMATQSSWRIISRMRG